DDSLALPGMAHAADAKHCRHCGAPYVFEAVYLGHLGRYRCPSCGQARPAPAVSATNVELDGVRSARFTLRSPAREARVEVRLPGLHNVHNALAAAALASALELPLDCIVAGLRDARAAVGRADAVTLSLDGATGDGATGDGARPGHRELRVLLVKNPAGANE